jgi:putative tricarboxylic transport membrane protein
MNTKKRIRAWLTADRVAALVFLTAVALYGWDSTTLSAALQVDVVGPGFFPKILTVFGLVLGLLLLFQREPRGDAENGSKDSGSHITSLLPALLLLGYVLALEPVGFPLATLVFLTVTFRYLGHPGWLSASLLSAVVTAVIFVLFYVGLDLKLPLGVFAGLV